MAREFFNAYHSYLEAIEPLNDAERGRLFTACLSYSMTGEVPELRGNERFVFAGMKSQIDRDKQSYAEKCERNRGNVLRRYTTVDDGIRTPAKPTKEKEKAKTKAKENAKEKECCAEGPRRFTKPTVEEIRLYCRERGNAVDPQRFYDFYEAKGWRVGNQPMKDWQAAVRTWEGRDSMKPCDSGGFAKKGARPALVQHTFTDDDLSHLLVDLDADLPQGRKEAG